MRLLQFTDTHLIADPQGRIRGATTLPRLQACLAHARRRHLPADVVAVTGDLVQDDPVAYGALELALDRLDAPSSSSRATTTCRTNSAGGSTARRSRWVARSPAAAGGS